MSINMPLARTKGIIVQETSDECLIYDFNTNKALCLNKLSSEIWKLCDGTKTIREAAEIVGKQMNIKIEEDFIWLAIDGLEKNRLLESVITRPTEFKNLSRRKVLFKYALPALALPTVMSIIAPTAVSAQSVAAVTCPTIPPGCNGNSVPLPVGCTCTLNCSNCVDSDCDLSNGTFNPGICA